MNSSEQISKRFAELIGQGQRVLSTKRAGTSGFTWVDNLQASEWLTSAQAFICNVMGKGSEHYSRYTRFSDHGARFEYIESALGVLQAAKVDFDGGYLLEFKRRIEAEVFDDFLEQAEYFLRDGYFQVAAVVAGATLEDGLRKLCIRRNIALPEKPKLDRMNGELAKSGVYDKLIQKKITVMADIRNKAAHGKWDEFKEEDARELVEGVRRFLTEYFTTETIE